MTPTPEVLVSAHVAWVWDTLNEFQREAFVVALTAQARATWEAAAVLLREQTPQDGPDGQFAEIEQFGQHVASLFDARAATRPSSATRAPIRA